MKEKKEIAFAITPSTGNDNPMVIIGTISIDVKIGNDEYRLKFEQPDSPTVPLKLKERGNDNVKVDDIVLIRPSRNLNSKRSNNKQIILNGKGIDELCDFSAKKEMDRLFGEHIGKFIRIDNAVWVNKKYIEGQTPDKTMVVVSYADFNKKIKKEKLVVSRHNACDVKRLDLRVITD